MNGYSCKSFEQVESWRGHCQTAGVACQCFGSRISSWTQKEETIQDVQLLSELTYESKKIYDIRYKSLLTFWLVNKGVPLCLNITSNWRRVQRLWPLGHLEPIVDQELDALWEQDLIEPSCSSFSSLIVMVRKKPQDLPEFRMCQDFRALNQRTILDKYPLHHLDLLIQKGGNARFWPGFV